MEHVKEGLTIIFAGPQRIGKTLGGVIWAVDAYQHDRKVMSNIQLGIPHEPLEFKDIQLADGKSRFRNAHVFIDELNFYFDARRSISGPNLEFGAFLLQQKKQGCNITGTTHSIDYLDLRLRQNHDFVVYPSVYPKYPDKPRIIRMVVENGPLQANYHKSFILDCGPFLGLYDTYAVYDPFKEAKKDREDLPRRRMQRPERRVNLMD